MVIKNSFKINFGPYIRDLRIKNGFSQRELAKKIGVAASYLNDIEKEKRTAPKPKIIRKLSVLLKTNIDYLNKHGVSIWDEWADKKGELGPIYGSQWRSWPVQDGESVDQIAEVISQIKNNPNSRRLIVSSWNVPQIEKMALPPCHVLFQFYVSQNKLSCQLYQRSADIFLGVPFNIASYALLTLMIGKVTGLQPGDFIHTLGDAHLYLNHLDQVDEQLSRRPFKLPEIQIARNTKNILEFVYDDFLLKGYESHPHIAASVAV